MNNLQPSEQAEADQAHEHIKSHMHELINKFFNMNIFQRFHLSKPASSKKSDFSAFFRETSPEDQKRILKGVVRKANEDQKKIVEQYRDLQAKTTR